MTVTMKDLIEHKIQITRWEEQEELEQKNSRLVVSLLAFLLVKSGEIFKDTLVSLCRGIH